MRKGQKHTPEARARIAAARAGKQHSLETREKIAAALRGRKLSDAHREKVVTARLARAQEERRWRERTKTMDKDIKRSFLADRRT